MCLQKSIAWCVPLLRNEQAPLLDLINANLWSFLARLTRYAKVNPTRLGIEAASFRILHGRELVEHLVVIRIDLPYHRDKTLAARGVDPFPLGVVKHVVHVLGNI